MCNFTIREQSILKQDLVDYAHESGQWETCYKEVEVKASGLQNRRGVEFEVGHFCYYKIKYKDFRGSWIAKVFVTKEDNWYIHFDFDKSTFIRTKNKYNNDYNFGDREEMVFLKSSTEQIHPCEFMSFEKELFESKMKDINEYL